MVICFFFHIPTYEVRINPVGYPNQIKSNLHWLKNLQPSPLIYFKSYWGWFLFAQHALWGNIPNIFIQYRNDALKYTCGNVPRGLMCRKRLENELFITLVPKTLWLCFLICWLKNFGDLYLIVIYIWSNFVFHHWV